MGPSEVFQSHNDVEVLSAGTIVSDRYRVLKQIGQGGFGVVYRVEHIQLKKRFALKVLNRDEGTIIERLRREAVVTSRIAHPNIVSVTDFGTTDNGHVYYVMELLQGETLVKLMNRKKTFSLSVALPILAAVCHALQAAHKAGVIHRDLKPDNIFLVPQEDAQNGVTRNVVKILDFGLAKIKTRASERLTQHGKTVGTVGYAAPEQLGAKELDHRVDIYSFGCIAFQMFAGKPVFQGRQIEMALAHIGEKAPLVRKRNPMARIPETMERLIARCLDKDPNKRPASCKDLLEDLREIARTMLTPEGLTWVGAYESSSRKTGDAWMTDTEEHPWWETLSSESFSGVKLFKGASIADSSEDDTMVDDRFLSSDDEQPLILSSSELDPFEGDLRPNTMMETLQIPVQAVQVMLVDSDQAFAEQITSALGGHSYKVSVVSGRKALARARQDPPDLILLSVELNDISGYSICSLFKKDDALKHTPLVLMTFDGAEEVFSLHQTLPLRADKYLVKPFTREVLLESMDALLSRPSSPDSSDEADSQVELSFDDVPNVTELVTAIDSPLPDSSDRWQISNRLLVGLFLVTLAVLLVTVVLIYFSTTKRSTSSLVLQVSPPAATLRLNGQRAIQRGPTRVFNRMGAGKVTVSASHPSCRTLARDVELKNGEVTVVNIALTCDPPD